ncbi:hypothetical protein C1A50_1159 [Paenibacillus polymyxa]|nr:hypothetical protein C1A50_1159 [Paenibacillus polymyxa]
MEPPGIPTPAVYIDAGEEKQSELLYIGFLYHNKDADIANSLNNPFF